MLNGNMEEEVISGLLFYQKSSGLVKKWSKKWGIFYERSSHGVSRLELSESKDKPGKKHVINLENCLSMQQEQANDGKRSLFVLRLCCPDDKSHALGWETRENLTMWHNKLSLTLFPVMDDGTCIINKGPYDVEIKQSDLTERLKLRGHYLLLVTSENIELLQPHNRKPVIKWPLHFLRKYGRDKQVFSLEAGRRCHSGEGMFYFVTDQYNAIFQNVEKHVKSLACRGRATSTSSNTGMPQTPPAVPAFHPKLSPTTPAPSSTAADDKVDNLYDNPLDARDDQNPAFSAESAYSYDEPINSMAPKPKSPKPGVKSPAGKKFGGKAPPLKKAPPPKPSSVRKQPPKSSPLQRPPMMRSVTTPQSATVDDRTYAEPDQLIQDDSEYSRLNIGGGSGDVAEYDSLSYPDTWKAGEEDSAYATAGEISPRFANVNEEESMYDHVQR